MKTTKLLLTLFISIMLFSCEEDDSVNVVELSGAPSISATVSPEDSGIYYFENTTANKGDFYSYFEVSDSNLKYNGNEILEYAFGSSGIKTVTLTVVGTYDYDVATQEIDVVVFSVPSNDNVLLNGDLEEGDGADFTNWSQNNGADNMTAELTEVYSGGRALKVSNAEEGPEEWKVQFVSDAFDTDPGVAYTASIWIKGAGAEVRYSTNPGLGNEQYAGNYTATEEWTEYSWPFTANTATTLLSLDMGKSAATFYVDAIKVVKD